MKTIKITLNKITNEITTEAFGYDGINCHFDLDKINEIIKADTIYTEQKDNNVNVILEVSNDNKNR